MKSSPLVFAITIATAWAAHATPAAHSRLKVIETSSTTSFEYEVRDKGWPGAHRETYESVWSATTRQCDMRGGYISEYHDGFKRSYFDTREGAARVNAYATCSMPYPEFDSRNDADPLPMASIARSAGTDGLSGMAQASGRANDAYRAARDLVYRTCLDQDRRIRFMSTGITALKDGTRQVEIRFACNSAMSASNLSD
jgi:hypothetical protein